MGTTTTAPARPAFRGTGLVAGLALALLVSVGTATGTGAEERNPVSSANQQMAVCNAFGGKGTTTDVDRTVEGVKSTVTVCKGGMAGGMVCVNTGAEASCVATSGKDPTPDQDFAPVTETGRDITAEPGIVADPAKPRDDLFPEAGQPIAAEPAQEVVADPGQFFTDDPLPVVRPVVRPFAPVADPGQDVVADPGQDSLVPAEDAEAIVPVPVEDDGIGTIDDPVPGEDAEMLEVGDEPTEVVTIDDEVVAIDGAEILEVSDEPSEAVTADGEVPVDDERP